MNAVQAKADRPPAKPDSYVHSNSVSPRLTMKYDPGRSIGAFSESLQLVLKAILRDQAGDAVCLYECVSPATLVLRESEGTTLGRLESATLQLSQQSSYWLWNLNASEWIDDAQQDVRVSDFPETLLHQFTSIVIAPIRQNGHLRGLITLGWRQVNLSGRDSAIARVRSLVDCAAALLLREPQPSATRRLLAEITQAESELANLKIAQWATDYVNSAKWTERESFRLQQHVSRVLDAADINQNLREHLTILQSRLHDRRLLATAKARVQHVFGMTEESAYLFLRNTSRRTRRPLRDIAQAVLRGDLQESPSDLVHSPQIPAARVTGGILRKSAGH